MSDDADHPDREAAELQHLFLPAPELPPKPAVPARERSTREPLAFLPPPAPDALLDVDLVAGRLQRLDDALHLVHGQNRDTVDLSVPFAVFLSRSRDAAGTDLLHLELRQHQTPRWARIGVSSRTDTFPGPVTSVPLLSRPFPFVPEPDMKVLLGLLRGAMQVAGREDWGLLPKLDAPLAIPRGVTRLARPEGRVQQALRRREMSIEEGDGEVLITYRPAGLREALLAFGAANGVFALALARPWPAPVDVLLLGCVALCVFLALRDLLNEVSVRVGRGIVERHEGPLPVPFGRWQEPVADLRQLYCREHVFRDRGGFRRRYEVRARLEGPRDRRVLGDLPTPEHAALVERTLESRLGIADAPVQGEMERD